MDHVVNLEVSISYMFHEIQHTSSVLLYMNRITSPTFMKMKKIQPLFMGFSAKRKSKENINQHIPVEISAIATE